jgi:DNA topoisomerase-1
MLDKADVFDKTKTREMIKKGRRARWWQRKGSPKKGFRYFDCNGKPITEQAQLERISSLVIPPAWKEVRICPQPGGRLQVVGMDSRGRIQYRYHTSFTEKKQREKFAKIEKFGEYLPKLKTTTNEHLALDGLPKEKVLALMMRLINSLYFRVGTELSVKHYKTYGITTLYKKHLKIGRGGKLEFNFVGKSHIEHRKVLVDPELAAVMKDLASLGKGRKLFRYVDEQGKRRAVTPAQVNMYLKSATDPMFSAKDFRTWGGSLLAALHLAEFGPAEDEKQIKKNIVRAVKCVAEELGNTPAVCRTSYIHPAVLQAYERGVTLEQFRPRKSRAIKLISAGLEPEEAALIRMFGSVGSASSAASPASSAKAAR